MSLTGALSQNLADGKVWPYIEQPPITDNPLSLGPGEKSGGKGKADGDGTVDTDDPVRETTGERLSLRLGWRLCELKKPRVGDWYNGECSVVSFTENA